MERTIDRVVADPVLMDDLTRFASKWHGVDGEDGLQQGLANIADYGDGFTGTDEELRRYAFATVRHAVSRLASKIPDEIPLSETTLGKQMRMSVNNPYMRVEDRMELIPILKGLPEIHQRILVLKHLEGLSTAEIARIEGIPEGTVMSRTHRATEAMREALGVS